MTAVPATRTEGIAGVLPAALAATRAAALACQPWHGRGDGEAADAAATEAMRAALAAAPGAGRIVIGEGEKDQAPMLRNGERFGTGSDPAFDVAVDPLECTSYLADGLPGALTTIAVVEAGCMWSPGPSHYVDKLVVGPEAREVIDITRSPESNLGHVAEALGKAVADLRVVVLAKPRHAELIARLRAAGASVATPSAGDVAGALEALLPHGDADLLMGIGGTPEGLMTACAARALGGGMQVRLAPQRDAETAALRAAGMDLAHPLGLDDLVWGEAFFVATGVSGGPLLRRPWRRDAGLCTESLIVTTGSARRVLHAGDPLESVAARQPAATAA
jgi:fructose-1,6-bisphosphatase II